MGRKSGILLIVAGGLLLGTPLICVPLYFYAHHYYTVGLTIDLKGYFVLGGWFLIGILLLAFGIRTLKAS